jgi:hypothetical protein
MQITTPGRFADSWSMFAGYEKDYPDNLSQEAKRWLALRAPGDGQN